MRINLNTKKKLRTIKKLTNNTKNNYNLKQKTNNNIVINPYIKWSRCNTNIIRSIKKGSLDKKESSNLSLYLSNLAIIEKHFKIRHHSAKMENHSISNEIVKRELLNEDLKILNKLDNDINLDIDKSINPKKLNNIEIRHNSNDDNDNDNIQIIDKDKMEKDKELKEEELLKMKKIQEEENMKKLKKCYSNTPYPTIINQEDKFNGICDHDNDDNYYNRRLYNNNDTNNNENINRKTNDQYILDRKIENYDNIIQNIKMATGKKDISHNFYVNQIPSDVLIRIFSNPMFSQNDYYKFCLVCHSWNQAATIVLWNKPYIYSFRQLVKFYQSILYNDKILKLNQEDPLIEAVQMQSPPPVQPFLTRTAVTTINSNNKYKYINHNLSRLVNKLDLTRVRLERPISTRQRTELYKALNILGDKLMPFLNSLSICREQCNSYLFLGTSIINSNEDYSNQALVPCINIKDHLSDTDLCFKEITFPLVHHLKFTDLNYKSVTTLIRCLKKFNHIETLYISIALFQSWKEWNNNNHHNNYLVFQKVIENLNSPQLKKIRFQNCCDLNDQACHTLFTKCKEITELEIFGSSNVSIDVLYYSLKMLKDLKVLSYSAISTPQFKLEDEEEERNIDDNNRDNNNNINNNNNNKKKKLYGIDFSHQPCASKIQIIDINSTGWSPYLNWMFHNQCGDSIKKLILTIQTEEERDTIYKAISSCRSLEELILNYRHESTENNDAPINNEQLSIDLDKLFLIKTENYQSKIKFLYISGLEIENSKRLTKYIESLKEENNEEMEETRKEEKNFAELSENLKFKQLKYLHLYLPSTKCPIEYILYQFPGLEEFVLNLSEPIEEELLENNERNNNNNNNQTIHNNENNNNNNENNDNNNDGNNDINVNNIQNINNEINTNDHTEIINASSTEIQSNINYDSNIENDHHILSNNNNNSINLKRSNFFKKIESHLKRLSIRSSSFGDGFTNKQINSIIEKCSCITNLELDCKSLTEDCLCNIVEILKGKLISMRLERVNRSTITDKFLSCVCQNNPSIQQLEIFAEHGKLDVTYEGTNYVIDKCKNLRYFSLGLEGFNPIIPYNLEQPSNYRSYFKILNYTSKKKFI